MQKITPFLWYDDKAEEAANFYVSLFENSRIGDTTRYDEAGAQAAKRPKGSVMTIEFQLEGQKFVALNGGPHFKFTEEVQCGWLKDKYGLSWQIVPTVLTEMLKDKDPAKAKRVMEAMLKMKKIDIKTLRRAYEQE
jgi:predicted 3-demethylubiquinone-9 3-methyltransferase (glyoxalase superfamily)